MLIKKNKEFLLLCKLLMAAFLETLVSYFHFIFVINDEYGNISSLRYSDLRDIRDFLILYFSCLILTAFFLILVSPEKSIYVKKYFIWIGFVINAIIFSLFLLTVGALRFNISVVFGIIESGIFGMLAAYFLRPILYPLK
jgi:hypothetical protein